MAVERRTFLAVDPGNTDVQMLIEVWPDGATIAYRDTTHGRWGPPHEAREVTESADLNAEAADV